MMPATREEMREEAGKRLQRLGLYQTYVENFRREGTVMVSEASNGLCRELTAEQQKRLEDLEAKRSILIYYVLLDLSKFYKNKPLSVIEYFLYIDCMRTEWESERVELASTSLVNAYAEDLVAPGNSEFKKIKIEKMVPAGLTLANRRSGPTKKWEIASSDFWAQEARMKWYKERKHLDWAEKNIIKAPASCRKAEKELKQAQKRFFDAGGNLNDLREGEDIPKERKRFFEAGGALYDVYSKLQLAQKKFERAEKRWREAPAKLEEARQTLEDMEKAN